MSATEQVKKTKRAPRRNYQRESLYLDMYLKAAIRLIESDIRDDDAYQAAQLRTFQNVQKFIEDNK